MTNPMVSRLLRKARSKVFLDRATAQSTVFLAGMGRSGTTWAADLVNYDATCRLMFEPFDSRRVRAARRFHYVQYMNDRVRDASLAASARRILSGRVRNKWVDIDNRRFVLRRRIIKDVRCNLMLRWLKSVCPEMAVVLMIRHPLSVAWSWMKLGWGADRAGSDFDSMLSQSEMFDDFPVLRQALHRIDVNDVFERIVFQWCAFHVVPLSQFQSGDLAIVFYENLLLDPLKELKWLFARLNRSYDPSRLSRSLEKPSITVFRETAGLRREELLDGWRRVFTPTQIQRSTDILKMVGLETMYVNDRPSTISCCPAFMTTAVSGPR